MSDEHPTPEMPSRSDEGSSQSLSVSSPAPGTPMAHPSDPGAHRVGSSVTSARAVANARIRKLAPRLIILAIMCIGVQTLMAVSYMGAFGKPDAKNAPFIVVSSTEGNAAYIANKLNQIDSRPVIASISTDREAAISEVKKDHAVGVYEFHPSQSGKTSDHLYYASAQGASRALLAQTVASRIASQADRKLETTDVVKAEAEDSRGTAAFYLVLAWLVGAYLLPAAMASVAGTRSETALGARLRLLLFAGYAILSGIVGAAIALYGISALRGNFWQIAAMGALLVFTVSTVTFGLTSLFGTIGIGMAILLFVILGNPSAGGAFAYDVLPEPWRTVGPYLPNGAGVDAIRSLSYFGGDDLARPLTVLAFWLALGVLSIFMVGNNTYRFAPEGVAFPEDESVGYIGEAVEHKLKIQGLQNAEPIQTGPGEPDRVCGEPDADEPRKATETTDPGVTEPGPR